MLDVFSTEPVDRWPDAARRLLGILDAVSTQLGREYGEPLRWRTGDRPGGAQDWDDHETVAAVMARQAGAATGTRGSVQGYLGNRTANMANCGWVANEDGMTFGANVDFYAEYPDDGARTLAAHPVERLLWLLSAAAVAARATQARIHTRSVYQLLTSARPDTDVGVLTLVPERFAAAGLPPGITVYPCPVGYPDSVIVAADLERVATDALSIVDDLLLLDDLLKR
jgi:hypothetical protein